MNGNPDVLAYVKAITYKYQIENKAEVINLEHVIGIEYPQVLTQPWPRAFNYHVEFFTGENPPSQVKQSIQNHFKKGSEEHVLNIFSDKLNQLIPAYKGQGYLHAWSNVLMVRKLSPKDKKNYPSEIVVKKIQTFQDVSLVNSIEPDYPSSTNGLDDPIINNLMAFYKGKICAKSH